MIIYLFLKSIKEREHEISNKTYPARRSPKIYRRQSTNIFSFNYLAHSFTSAQLKRR